jgi:NAD-dependent deacetylase
LSRKNMDAERPIFEQVAAWLAHAERGVAFTGAGISTESGIPDFRSPGGVWAKNTPVMYQDFVASADARHEYWRQKCEAHAEFAAAKPNAGHEVLARWEQAGRIRAVITQNIDGLHQDAGGRDVLELHGTARAIACLDCDTRFEVEPLLQMFRETSDVPACEKCGGLLKHATISFGQSLPQMVLYRSVKLARDADLMLAIGSSLVVTPAAELPRETKQRGGRLVIINRDETPLDHLADAIIRTPIGEALSQIDQRLLSRDSDSFATNR